MAFLAGHPTKVPLQVKQDDVDKKTALQNYSKVLHYSYSVSKAIPLKMEQGLKQTKKL